MISKTVKCPNCHHITTVQGIPGEKIILVCPKCDTKGVFIFPLPETQEPSQSTSPVILVKNLTKIYDTLKAVDNVSFTVKKGEIFGFLGPNGAGKTTTIKSLLGLIHPDTGYISINGYDMHQEGKNAKKYIGYLPEKVAFYENLTALQNLYFYAEMKHVSKEECKPLLQEFGLGDAADKKVAAFSKGMKQRLGMARAALGKPSILILDEPSTGLDPRGVVLIRDKIRQMRENGTTVFISSHILSEIQAICDRVGIINKGVLVAEDTVSNLGKRLNLKPRITLELDQVSEEILEAVRGIPGVEEVEKTGNSIDVVCEPGTKAKVIIAIEKTGGTVINLQTREPSLEDVFMKITED